ncbi:hypothetical protein [Nocardiopsis sp. FR4]|uniref:hypothetical protein n=1 Tax=Nocardiopsis sp. FR4 TaxID=2605985 RepID=UPI0013591750|nr:hypothetical protein [Nocardiopsis sp. FR4]
MAVLTVEVFALAPDTAAPLNQSQQYDLFTRFTDAITVLTTPYGPVVVMGSAVDTYDNGALVHALCVATSGEEATETVAAHLETAMAADTETFARWELAAGRTSVLCSDN